MESRLFDPSRPRFTRLVFVQIVPGPSRERRLSKAFEAVPIHRSAVLNTNASAMKARLLAELFPMEIGPERSRAPLATVRKLSGPRSPTTRKPALAHTVPAPVIVAALSVAVLERPMVACGVSNRARSEIWAWLLDPLKPINTEGFCTFQT